MIPPLPSSLPPLRLALSLLCLATLAGCSCSPPPPPGIQQGYAPEQPVAFSHAVHAGEYGIDCQYCHTGAETSRHAGVPPGSTCMNCHSQVKTESPEIVKVATAVKEGRGIEWIKVHRLPDHAYFSHANHVTAGLQCQQCHGPVEQMVRVEQVQSMTMGWCLDCHRAIENEGRTAPKLEAAALIAAADGISQDTSKPRVLHPPTDCSACHR